ncbi:MAG: hypothetical protein JOY78_03345 [Pseudonocardia sp.]|nr:hypothetical protein [Pseudonocardia sp.]
MISARLDGLACTRVGAGACDVGRTLAARPDGLIGAVARARERAEAGRIRRVLPVWPRLVDAVTRTCERAGAGRIRRVFAARLDRLVGAAGHARIGVVDASAAAPRACAGRRDGLARTGGAACRPPATGCGGVGIAVVDD